MTLMYHPISIKEFQSSFPIHDWVRSTTFSFTLLLFMIDKSTVQVLERNDVEREQDSRG